MCFNRKKSDLPAEILFVSKIPITPYAFASNARNRIYFAYRRIARRLSVVADKIVIARNEQVH